MAGVKETTEALVALNEVTIFLITRFKDGIDFSDFKAIWDKITTDEEFKTILSNAYDNIGKVPEEIADIDFVEGVELGSLQLKYLPKILKALKSQQ